MARTKPPPYLEKNATFGSISCTWNISNSTHIGTDWYAFRKSTELRAKYRDMEKVAPLMRKHPGAPPPGGPLDAILREGMRGQESRKKIIEV